MNFLEAITKLVALIEAALRLRRVLRIRGSLVSRFTELASYENVSLDLVLDIKDCRGQTAVLEKRQRVVFRSQETGVVRDLVWGEGQTLARYAADGAHRLIVRREGSRKAVLLGLDRPPSRGEAFFLRTTRLIENGFTASKEYFEAQVERPTRRLSLKILFPKLRPPLSAHLATIPPDTAKRIRVKFMRDGRPFLAWSLKGPERYRIYGLHWSW